MSAMLENRYEVITAADRPITTKFGKQMQNDMPMTIHTSKLKPYIAVHCVQLLFVERNTGSAVCVAVYRFENYTDDRITHNQLA